MLQTCNAGNSVTNSSLENGIINKKTRQRGAIAGYNKTPGEGKLIPQQRFKSCLNKVAVVGKRFFDLPAFHNDE